MKKSILPIVLIFLMLIMLLSLKVLPKSEKVSVVYIPKTTDVKFDFASVRVGEYHSQTVKIVNTTTEDLELAVKLSCSACLNAVLNPPVIHSGAEGQLVLKLNTAKFENKNMESYRVSAILSTVSNKMKNYNCKIDCSYRILAGVSVPNQVSFGRQEVNTIKEQTRSINISNAYGSAVMIAVPRLSRLGKFRNNYNSQLEITLEPGKDFSVPVSSVTDDIPCSDTMQITVHYPESIITKDVELMAFKKSLYRLDPPLMYFSKSQDNYAPERCELKSSLVKDVIKIKNITYNEAKLQVNQVSQNAFEIKPKGNKFDCINAESVLVSFDTGNLPSTTTLYVFPIP